VTRLAHHFALVFMLVFFASGALASEPQTRYFGYYDPSYDLSKSEAGIAVSSFDVKAVASTAAEYTDNAKLTKRNKRSDISNITTAGIAAESNWDRHAFGAGVVGGAKRFAKETSENKNAVRLFTNGRLDINDVWNVSANLQYVMDSENRDNPQEQFSNLSRLRDYTDIGGDISLNYDAGILNFTTRAGLNHITYDTLDGETLGFRDRDVYRYSTRIAYPLTDLIDVYVQPSYTKEIYAEKADATGIARDSKAYQLYGGIVYQVTDLTTLDVAIGQIKRQFADARLKDATGLGFDASLNWRPLDELSVDASLNRSIESTTLAGVNDLIVTGGSIAPTYSFTDQFSVSTEVGYDNYRFSGTALTDQDYFAGVGVNYLWLNGMNTGLRYRFRERTSDSLNRDFTNNTVLLIVSGSL